jgi:hypothetical protein
LPHVLLSHPTPPYLRKALSQTETRGSPRVTIPEGGREQNDSDPWRVDSAAGLDELLVEGWAHLRDDSKVGWAKTLAGM